MTAHCGPLLLPLGKQISAVGGSEWSASRTCRLTSGEVKWWLGGPQSRMDAAGNLIAICLSYIRPTPWLAPLWDIHLQTRRERLSFVWVWWVVCLFEGRDAVWNSDMRCKKPSGISFSTTITAFRRGYFFDGWSVDLVHSCLNIFLVEFPFLSYSYSTTFLRN